MSTGSRRQARAHHHPRATENDFQEWARLPGNIWWQVEEFKHQGNAIINQDPGGAIQFYSMALSIDDDPTHPFNLLTPRERATLYSNRCTAWTKIRNLGRAFEDAMACISVDPTFQKGYWRAATVMKQMNKEDEALEALIDGYPKILGSDREAVNFRVNFIYEITTLTVRLWDKWKKSQFLFRLLDIPTSVWTEVVQRLAKNKDYHALRLVFLRGGIQSGKTYEIGKGGAATGCDTSAIDLRTIVRDLFNIYDNWSMHLVLELLKHGSKVEGLSQKEGDTPLHCAVENTLRTGWVGLLEYLLSKVFTTSERRNLPDRFGDSLFHLVAKTTGPFSHAKTVVDILRKHVVDPSRKDWRGYMPLDVVPMSSPHYTEIRRLLTETVVAWEQFMRQQRNEQQFQQHSRSMPGQRFPGPRFSPPNAAFPGNQTRPSQTRYYPTRPQAKPQPSPPPSPQFFDPSRIFNTPSRPSAPAPFFDHSKLFAEPQKPTWQQEEMVKQKQREEQQKKERLKQERLRKEEERKRQEELEARRQQQLEEQQRQEKEEQIRARLMMEEQRKREDERRRLQEEQKREEERRRLQEEKRQKEKERQEKLRQKQEEKKRRENQKRKERKELQRKKEAEAKLSTYQKGLTFQKQGKHDQAVPLFLEFIGKEHRNPVIYRDVDRCKDALVESLEHCQEIPDSVKCEAPPTYWNTTVQELADKNKWWSLFLLLVGGSYSINWNSMGIAHGCDASGVSIMAFLNQWEGMNMAPGRLTMVKALLENKAKPDGLLNDSITPLAHCLKTENYELVNLLLTHEASPKLLVMDPGDTPFHSALKIGFKQDDRKFAILDLLLTKYSADPTAATYLDKNARDRAGNTLFHLALTGGSKNQSLNAVKILSQHKVNPWLRDHGGRVPLRMVTNKDRRYMYLAEAAKYYDAASESIPSVPRGDNQGSSSDGIRVSGVPNNWSERDRESGQEGRQQPTTARPTERMPQREKLRRELEQLLGALPMYVPQQAELEDTVETHGEPLTSPPRISSRQKEPEEILKQGVEDEGEKIDEADEEMEDEEDEDEEMEAIDANIFDDLTWEVECTAKVWKFLHDRQVPHKLKETAIRKIQMLGSGDWRGRLCKPLEGQPKQHNMKLYEARLTKGGRILWEVAIAFSPRCSEESEKRLGSGDGTSEDTAVAGGRVYSEIIRIWDIFTDHNKLSHAIDVIVKSVERGEECIIRKNLVGISKKSTTGVIMTLRLPTYFREITGNSPDRNSRPVDNAKKIPQPYFPPASSRENEYHIMKFYSVNSTLVNAMLNDNDVKVDFPFRVTELEHAIINLQPRPASSILLLGRSGTGKTTCCLYRMWTKFFKYWQQVSMTGEPLIPRDIAFIHQDKPDEDQDESDSETDSSSASNKPSRADVRMDFRRDSCNSKSVESSGTGPFNDEGDTNMEMIMDHLHQIFVTKNAVLCSEVQRNFCNMSHACEFAHDPLAQQDTPIPHRFQDAHQARFPLFLSSRQFLLILDASLPNSYFPRDADGSLKRKIRGWDEEDGPLTFIPLIDEEDDEEEGLAPAVPDEDTTQEGALTDNTNPHGQHEAQGPAAAQKARYDPRREVTYEVFAFELWPRINKKKLPYHSTLVWMEITSFIKGSVEALHTDSGYLSLDSYLALGQKRASNFTADREEIYSLFKTYEHVKSQKNLFDEGDLVFHVYRRLRDVRTLDWVLHEIYVDETQDFTQAELALFIRCSHDPNSLFLTGDTAQSIMRGVAFRFDDLKSLFHYASKSVKALGKHSAVTVPKKVYQLTHNYRSHAGILNLASTIVDLMTHFFPNSFDRLERDQGLFHGPSPVLLESCSSSDLALLLCGNKRKTSEIEFGAHQVILVANEKAIDQLPAELRLGLVMTIYEAKGLEFDDVLLYNFFKDSEAGKEWRVITDYLNELIAQQQNRSKELQDKSLKEIDVESLTATIRPRPLKFNHDEHKALSSDLKHLYTAITRARVNVWIFDEDETKRGPMFELFRCLRLVKGIGPHAKQDIEGPDLDAMFVEKSSSWEWIQRGLYFFEKKIWKVAAECYQRGGDEKRELLARAHHQAMEAERMRDQLHAMREKFLQAASLFLKCGSSRMAVNCLYNAREFALLAQLLEKQGEFSKAAKIYEKRLNRVSDACRCLELMKDYAKALDLLCSVGLHTKALDVIDRFKRFEQELKKKGKPLPKHVKRPGSTHTLSELIFKSAEYHFKNGDSGQMLDALEQLDHFEARVDFLRKRGLFAEAVKMLKDGGRLLDAAKILREQGKLEEACTILESSNHPEFVAECRLGQARKLLLEPGSAEDQTAAISLLTKAESLFTRCGDSVRKAETQLLLGQLKKDAAKIREANIAFDRMSHTAGESECTDHLIKLSLPSATSIKGRVFQQLKNLLELICALFVGTSPEQERQRRLCEEFFGLAPGEEGMLRIQRCEGARVLSALDKSLLQVSYIKAEKAREAIARCCLIPRALWWVKGARELLRGEMQKLTQCSDYVIGIPCSKPADTCQQLHEPYKFHHVEGRVSCLVQLIEIDSILEKASKLSNFKSADKLVAEIKRSQGKSAKKCKALYDVFFPEHCHQRFIGETASAMQKFLRLVRHTAVEKQLKAFAESERKEVDARRLRTDTDLYLMCHNIYLLIGEKPTVMENLVKQEEVDCLNWQKKDRWKHPQPLGMHPLFNNDPRKGFLSYKRRHLDSFASLYKNRDALESLSSFNRFMGTLANKPVDPLLPSISNTVALIEAKVTMMLALGAKIQQCSVAIPASYLAQAGFLDAICCPGQGHAMYSAVSNSAVNKDTRGQTCRLVSLICGTTRSGRDFNVLADAFSSVEYIHTGEAERTLVLVLVMLCNAGLALPAQIIRDTREALQSIAPSEEHLPKRVHTALCNVNKAQSRRNALQILEKLLAARDDEYLRECTWSPHMPPRGAPGLEFHKLKIKNFDDVHFETLRSKSPTVFTELAEGNVHQRGRDFEDKDEDVAREGEGSGDNSEEEGELRLEVSSEEAAKIQQEQETLQKERAAKIIRRVLKANRLLRLAALLRSCAYITLTVKPEVEAKSETTAVGWVSQQLVEFQHIPTGCTICNVRLREVQEVRPEPRDAAEEVQDGDDAAGEDDSVETDREPEPEADSKDDLPTQEEHESTEFHKQRHQEFLQYGYMLRDEVYPLITDVDKLLKELRFPSLTGENTGDSGQFKYFEEDLSRRRQDLASKMTEIQNQRAFEKLADVRHAVDQLKKGFENSKRKLEQQRAAEHQDKTVDSDTEEADKMPFEEGEDADEDKILPVAEQPTRRKGGRNKGRGQKQKGRWNGRMGKRK